MRIGICDDLYTDRNHLSQLLRDYCAEKNIPLEISEYESAEEFLDAWKPRSLQIIFLDVYMDGISGVEAARKIRESDPECAIIFTTTSSDHAIDSYEVHAADYLLKPFGKREVAEAMEWCEETMADMLKGIEIMSDREKHFVQLKDIVYVEVYGRVSVIHTAEGEITTNKSLADLEAEIGEGNFLRCNRSYLINMDQVLGLAEEGFKMKNGDAVPISSANAARVKQSFYDWLFRKTWEGR